MYISDPSDLAIQQLQQVNLFEGLALTELWAIYRAGRTFQVEAGAFFFHQGDAASALYVLITGQVKMTQLGREGQQVLARVVTAGEDFGTVAVLSGINYPLSAQAVDDCLALVWSKEVVQRLLMLYPALTLNTLHQLAERFKDLQDRYRELATERVERRVARNLLRLAKHAGRSLDGKIVLKVTLSRQDLAEMSGTTLYSVSRILSHWEQRGLVETGRERVVIRQPEGLLLVAEELSPKNPV